MTNTKAWIYYFGKKTSQVPHYSTYDFPDYYKLKADEKAKWTVNRISLNKLMEGLNLSVSFVVGITGLDRAKVFKGLHLANYELWLNREEMFVLNSFLSAIEQHRYYHDTLPMHGIPITHFSGVQMAFDWEQYLLDNVEFGLYEDEYKKERNYRHVS
ncbi:hypothetical protein [Bacillus cereus]|uniref:Uncharacterized protein n=1 Tax=Bacillus cereus (strain VD014) TaxID=1053223 RepID=A0A9W5K4P5_BACC8|nr:hypothetical protein [Bacillus cereus]EJR18259.1 hypothetical protein IIA_04212 [Bacillus cereus VD014]HDR8152878.1 hypothetical protein [Bacillus cereus]